MTFRTFFGLCIIIFSNILWAEEIKLNASHPGKYTVKQGDTLWNISKKFLQNPWQWSEIWQQNGKIENPNLIFPGDIVALTFVNGKPRLGLANPKQNLLAPRMREISAQEAIKVIPIEAIESFLTSPRIVSKKDLKMAPYVVDFAKEHLLAGAGDRIYVRSISQNKGLNFTVVREGNEFLQTESNETLGYEAIYLADAVLEKTGDPATLEITNSRSVIRKGDKLLPSEGGQIALNFFPKTPDVQIKGEIISVLDGVSQLGQHNIVAINKGSSEGLKPGHTLKIMKRGKTINDSYGELRNEKINLPNEEAGVLMIFRAFNKISYGIIMTAVDAIHINDYVISP